MSFDITAICHYILQERQEKCIQGGHESAYLQTNQGGRVTAVPVGDPEISRK